MTVSHAHATHTRKTDANLAAKEEVSTELTFDGICYQESGDTKIFTTDIGIHNRVFGGEAHFPKRVRITVTPLFD